MAKNVLRVNGRNGESMWLENDKVFFRSENVTHELEVDDFTRFAILNVEEARAEVEAIKDPVGVWCDETPSTKGKSLLLTGVGKRHCWVMEVTKSQGPNAIAFAKEICPVETEEKEELQYRLYAAIQTPKGALFTVGSIVCAFAAYYFVGIQEQPVIGLICAGASIFMFVNVK